MPDLLILEWAPDSLHALVVAPGSPPMVRTSAQMASVDHADTRIPVAQAGESLRAWLAEASITADQAIVVIPRELVVMRKLQVPQAPPDELPELVRFQAATRTSASIETLALDYLPLPALDPEQGLDVISITMDRDSLQRIKQICQAAKLNLQHVMLSSLTVGELVRTEKARTLGIEHADLVVYQQANRLEASIFDFGTLVFSHSTQLTKDQAGASSVDQLKPFKSDLARSLLNYNQDRPGSTIQTCYYVSGTPDAGVLELLEQRFPENVVSLTAADHPGRVPAGFEAAYGAALPVSDERVRLDLLHPRKRREIPDRRKWYYGAAAAVVLLAVVLAYAVFHSKKSALESSISTLRQDVNSKNEQLKKGKPKADAHQRLAHWKQGDADPIELWNALRTQLNTTDRVYLTEVRVVPQAGEMQARYVSRGQARARADVDLLTQLLSDHGFRVRPTTPRIGNRDPEYPWEFELDVELPRSLAAALLAESSGNSATAPSK